MRWLRRGWPAQSQSHGQCIRAESTEGTLRGTHTTGCEVSCLSWRPTHPHASLAGTKLWLQMPDSAQGVHSTDSLPSPPLKTLAPQTQKWWVPHAARACTKLYGISTMHCASANGRLLYMPVRANQPQHTLLLSRPRSAASGDDQHTTLLVR